jgi:hypothetical protein
MDWRGWSKHRAAQAVGCRDWPEDLVRLPALVPWLPFAWVSDAATIACRACTEGVGFAVIQTVFEGAHENTFEQLRVNQLKYELPVAFGHDEPPAGAKFPSFMEDYRTRGTPWFTVIDAGGGIVFSDFHLDADHLVNELGQA